MTVYLLPKHCKVLPDVPKSDNKIVFKTKLYLFLFLLVNILT